MLNWRKLKDRLIGRWFNVYLLRGWSRIGFILHMYTTLIALVGVISLLAGYSPRGYLGWIWLAFLVFLVGLALVIPSLLYGYWDYSKRGSYKIEAIRMFEANPISLQITDLGWDVLELICKKLDIEPPKEFQEMHKWIKESRKRLGV